MCQRVDAFSAYGLDSVPMFGLYGALLRLAWAFVLPFQMVIPLLTGRPGVRLLDRLGRPLAVASRGYWIHAVSVGEVRLALALMTRLKKQLPGLPLHLTTSTSTGRALAEAARHDSSPGRPDSVSYLPFDLVRSMGRLLDRLQPRAILIVETEIWPNLIRVASQRGIPIIFVNGRISRRAFPRYRIVARFLRHVLHDVRLFSMQTEEDALRIRSLGAPEDRVRVTGNLKFDLPTPAVAGADVRRRLGLNNGDVLFVAGSTAPGEESPVLQAFSALRQAFPTARLVIAPRHLKDLARAESTLSAWPYRPLTWSQLTLAGRERSPAAEGYDVLLVDAMGILPEIYAAADLVFVGGSLVNRGGHNILEPAALGKPVLFGPHVENFSAAAETLTEAGAAFVARDGRELGQLAIRLASDHAAYEVASTMARRVIQAHSGAMAATLRLIDETIHRGAADRGAVRAS